MRRNLTISGISLLAAGAAIAFYFLYLHERPSAPALPEAKAEREILFYRHPMDPSITSPVPAKDEMGMDYVLVREEDGPIAGEAGGTVVISPEKIQKIGVRSEEIKTRTIRRVIRTVGRVEPVEDLVYSVNTKVGGWVERLYVDRTDLMIHPGEALFELYSPELIRAQEEYLLSLRSYEKTKDSPYDEIRERARALVEASRKRLKYLDVSDEQIREMELKGEIRRTLAVRAPAHGGVVEKMVVQGQRVEAGEPLFSVIDHSMVWVYGEIYEYEIPFIKVGQKARLSPSYSPSEVYNARIDHIYSHLGSIRYETEGGREVRTAKVRFELKNPAHKLKLGMYLNIELAVDAAKDAPSVPESALIDTGDRQVVIIDKRDGRFEPREVAAGARGENHVEILKGVSLGEWVVTSANFLIDSESNLKAALGAMGDMPLAGEEKAEDEKDAVRPTHAH